MISVSREKFLSFVDSKFIFLIWENFLFGVAIELRNKQINKIEQREANKCFAVAEVDFYHTLL